MALGPSTSIKVVWPRTRWGGGRGEKYFLHRECNVKLRKEGYTSDHPDLFAYLQAVAEKFTTAMDPARRLSRISGLVSLYQSVA